MAKTTRVGVVLSAGGVRGVYAHTGFLQTLDAMPIRFSAFAGCSAGAIVGGIYASGTPLNQWLDALAHLQRKDFWQPGSWRRAIWELMRYRGRHFTGVAGMDASLDFCRQNLAVSTFEECRIPFHALATNLTNAEKVMLSEGDLALAIAASAAIPLLYRPVEINGKYYCDGGVIDLGPTDAICCREKLDVLIVHHVATRTKGFHNAHASSEDGWPILGIMDSLLFRNRPWYLSDQPLTFRSCPCGCNALIVVLEPTLPELPWPQTKRGPDVQAAAKFQAETLLEPWMDVLLSRPHELLEQVTPQISSPINGGCH